MTTEPISEKQLGEKAITAWGLPSQLNMLAEECSELAHAALKIQRKNTIKEYCNLAEEIADVQICINQIKDAFKMGVDIDFFRDEKLGKLQSLLEKPL